MLLDDCTAVAQLILCCRPIVILLDRREVSIHMDRRCEGRPIARLDCSLLQMRYRVAPTPGCALPFVDTLTRADSLARRPSLAGIPMPRLLSSCRSQPFTGALWLLRTRTRRPLS